MTFVTDADTFSAGTERFRADAGGYVTELPAVPASVVFPAQSVAVPGWLVALPV